VIAGTAAITLVLLLAPEDVRGELAGGVGALFLAAAGWADRLLKADQS
jgi:hypothetical protein